MYTILPTQQSSPRLRRRAVGDPHSDKDEEAGKGEVYMVSQSVVYVQVKLGPIRETGLMLHVFFLLSRSPRE